MAKVITSEAYELIRQDVVRVINNALLFALPAAMLCLEQLIAGKNLKEILPILYLWLLNTLLDIARKFVQANTYR